MFIFELINIHIYYMTVADYSDIKNIILSMLNTITISKVDLNEAIKLGLEVTDLQIADE